MEYFCLDHPSDQLIFCSRRDCKNIADYLEVNERGREESVWIPSRWVGTKLGWIESFPQLSGSSCDIRHRTATLSYSSLLLVVETERQICERFEAELATIAAIDRRYYSNPSPTVIERADYAVRQLHLESARSRFYAELESSWEYSLRQFRRCRFLAGRSRRRRP
jgi:hypothetical protein